MNTRIVRFLVGLVISGGCLLPVLASAQGNVGAAGKCVANEAALQKVLDAMDRAAASFRSMQAAFVWDQYQSVVQESDIQRGTMYIRKPGKKAAQFAVNITDPSVPRKYLLYSEGTLQIYDYKAGGINRITQYAAGGNSTVLESFLLLGFGSRGHDLNAQFEVHYGCTEEIGGHPTSKLELVPRNPRVLRMFDRIVLWIDSHSGISVQQQFFAPASGDYRLAKYSNIDLEHEPQDKNFRLPVVGKPEVLKP